MASIWNPGTGGLIPVADADGSYLSQYYKVLDDNGQSVFAITDFTYVPNTNSLEVIINGATQITGKDYVENTGNIVTLVVPAIKDDDVLIRGFVGSEASQSAAVSAESAAASAALAAAAAASIVGINNTFIGTTGVTLTLDGNNKTFNVAPGKQFQAGQFVMLTPPANPAMYIVGRINSYSTVTGVMNISVIKYVGIGSFNFWNVSMTGEPQPLPNIFTDPTLLAQTQSIILSFI